MAAATDKATLAPVMYAASAATSTDQAACSGVPVSSSWSVSAAEVTAVKVWVPRTTVTATPASAPVVPPMLKPAAFSAMLTVSSPATASTRRVSAPAGLTVISNVAVSAL